MFKPNKASSLTDFIGREVLEGWTGKEMVPFVDERSNNNDFGYNEVIHNAPVLVQKGDFRLCRLPDLLWNF